MPLDVTSRMADVLVSPAAPQLVHDPGAPRASAPHFDDTPQRHAHQAARVAVARAQAAHGERERLLRAARAALELARTLPPPGPAISSGAAAAPPRGATVHEHGPGPPAALVNHACSSSRSVTAVSLQQVAEPTHAATEPTQMSLVQQHLDHLAVHTARLAVPLRHAHGIEPSSLYAVAAVSHGADGPAQSFRAQSLSTRRQTLQDARIQETGTSLSMTLEVQFFRPSQRLRGASVLTQGAVSRVRSLQMRPPVLVPMYDTPRLMHR